MDPIQALGPVVTDFVQALESLETKIEGITSVALGDVNAELLVMGGALKTQAGQLAALIEQDILTQLGPLGGLVTDVEQAIAAAETSIDAKLQIVIAEVRNAGQLVKKAISDAQADLADVGKDIADAVASTGTEIRKLIDETGKLLISDATNARRRLEQAGSVLETNFKRGAEVAAGVLATAQSDVDAALTNLAADFESKVAAAKADLQQGMTAVLAQAEQDAAAGVAEVSTAVDYELSKFAAAASAINADVSVRLTGFDSAITKTIGDVVKTVDAEIAKINNSISSLLTLLLSFSFVLLVMVVAAGFLVRR